MTDLRHSTAFATVLGPAFETADDAKAWACDELPGSESQSLLHFESLSLLVAQERGLVDVAADDVRGGAYIAVAKASGFTRAGWDLLEIGTTVEWRFHDGYPWETVNRDDTDARDDYDERDRCG